MSRCKKLTLLAVIDRALDNQKRTDRLQGLIITFTCCSAVIVAPFAAILALSEGQLALSLGLGTVPALLWAGSKARRMFKKSIDA